MTKDERLKKFADVNIYPVTCEKLSRGRSDIDILNGVIAGGAKIIQLREKDILKRELYELAKKFREITERNGLLLIINDHVDIALSVKADGVHLGQDDMPLSAARDLAPELIIGVSTHDEAEAEAAFRGGADYVNIGPVFPTGTKEGVSEFLGVKRVSAISKRIKIPFTVMGGINLDNIHEVVSAGAKKVAVVSAITMSDDIAHATRDLIKKITLNQ
jgi:thiamine-phosphate pyrophosphorylase